MIKIEKKIAVLYSGFSQRSFQNEVIVDGEIYPGGYSQHNGTFVAPIDGMSICGFILTLRHRLLSFVSGQVNLGCPDWKFWDFCFFGHFSFFDRKTKAILAFGVDLTKVLAAKN